MNKVHSKQIFITGLILVIFLNGCVSNRQVAYLQYEDELKGLKEIPTDTILRKYESGELLYKLQPEDAVSIKISSTTPPEYNPFKIADQYMVAGGSQNTATGNSSSSNGYRIDPWGYLHLPVIGKFKAQGLNLEQLEDTINVLASEELEDPLTKVNLINFHFTIMGEAGGGNLTTSERSLTMMEAISMGGGPSEYADLSKVKVIRTCGNEKYVFYVNLLDESFISSEFYFVHPHDLIIVPPLYTREFLRYVVPNISMVASSISLIVSLLTLFSLK